MPANAQQLEGAVAFFAFNWKQITGNHVEADAGILGNTQPVLTADPGVQTKFILTQEASVELQGLHSS